MAFSTFMCTVATCKEDFYSRKLFLQHLKNHMYNDFKVSCPFDECTKKYSVPQSFTSHLSRCHPTESKKKKDSSKSFTTLLGQRMHIFPQSQRTMENMEIKKIVTEALPNLDTHKYEKLEQVLSKYGVTSSDDMRCLDEEDFLKDDLLTLVQARRLVKFSSKGSNVPAVVQDVERSSSGFSNEPWESDSPDTTSHSSKTFWAYNYVLPWNKISNNLTLALETGKPLTGLQRHDLIKVLAADMLFVHGKPSRAKLEAIAHRVFAKYPQSFKVVADGVTLSDGFRWFINQLENCLANSTRGKKNCSKTNTVKPYGFHNWKPTTKSAPCLPDLESDKEHLKQLQALTDPDMKQVKQLMKNTFHLQQRDMQQMLTVKRIKEEWPFLFNGDCLIQYYSLSRGDEVDILENLITKAANIYRLMEESKRPAVFRTIAFINGECLTIQNDRPKMNSFLLLLSRYFGEDETQLFKSFEDEPMEEILMKIPLSPFIIIRGGTTTTAEEFAVAIERCTVAKFDTFLKAVRYSFCSFFVMNMEYPRKSALTMEFVQRYFAKVMDPGTRTSKKRKLDIHPKILRVVSDLSAIEQD